MKLNVFVAFAALAFHTSIVLAAPVDSDALATREDHIGDFAARDFTDADEYQARETPFESMGLDGREYLDELEARQDELADIFIRQGGGLPLGKSTTSPLVVEKYPGAPSDRYLVKVKDDISKTDLMAQVQEAQGVITNNWTIINGFAGKFDTNVLNIILESPDVEAVTQDGVTNISTVQLNAPWGLNRISRRRRLPIGSNPNSLIYPYHFRGHRLGHGVDIYIVDTGVRITHETFGGRAVWGKTFGGYPDADGNGHGTHVAGTAAGRRYGVAKKAKIIAVKVLNDLGLGTFSDAIDGLNWVQMEAGKKRKPSVVNLSLGGPANIMLDLAVRSLTNGGVHVAVAAGNDGVDASGFSPAREPSACTVGASDIDDARPLFSNFGDPIKVFAPGELITSAWIGSDTDVQTISGTSMASPHVAGLMAYFISNYHDISPAHMIKKIQRLAVPGALSNIPSGTVNLLAHNRKW